MAKLFNTYVCLIAITPFLEKANLFKEAAQEKKLRSVP